MDDLETLWNLPTAPGRDDDSDKKARRNAQYEYWYAMRDYLEHHLAQGEIMLKQILADIERLHIEERRELQEKQR